MNVTNISNSDKTYDPFLLDALAITKKDLEKAETPNNAEKPKGWEKQILLDALEKLEETISPDESSPLNYSQSAPIESYEEALTELKNLVSSDFKSIAAKAQANLTPADILYLFEDEKSFLV
ncbi:MAG: hypothetical protein Kapaf2KO_00060 [Candidatus Kapaibacteriales bacterium]